MIQVNAIGDTCPIPVVKTKNAIKELGGSGLVKTLVDNEIAVQNLAKMAKQKCYGIKTEKLAENRYEVTLEIGENEDKAQEDHPDETFSCTPEPQTGQTVIVVSSEEMGVGEEELGKVLMKGFIYALVQQDEPLRTVIFYNGGARLTCADSPSLEDLRSLEARGTEILTCGTCLNYYGLTESLRVGSVTNMYTITEKLALAGHIIKP